MPVMAYNFLQSTRLLSEAILSFTKRCLNGMEANKKKMEDNINNSLMLVTYLSPYIGYEKSAQIAKKALKENISLKEACVALNFLSEEEFARIIKAVK